MTLHLNTLNAIPGLDPINSVVIYCDLNAVPVSRIKILSILSIYNRFPQHEWITIPKIIAQYDQLYRSMSVILSGTIIC